MTSTWVDFKAVKHAVSMEMALAYYGVMLRCIHGPCLRGRCPLPSHASRSSAQSLIVDIEKNAWACHSGSCVASRGGRTGGNVLDFVAAMERCSVRDAALKLQEWFAVAAIPVPARQIISAAEGHPAFSHTDTPESNQPLPFTLWGIDLHHPYLAKRRVDLKTATNFGIGFYPGKGSMEGRIVIPIHNEDGILVAYAGRNLDQSEPRYKFPARFRKSLVLFNLHRAIHCGKAATVVEGFFDCFNVHQAGFPCVVALMGCSLSRQQEVLLQQHFHQVTLMLDGDNAGRRAGAMIAARLVPKLAVRVVEIPLGSQPDQLGADQVHCLCDPDFF
jgi:Toprim-like/DNA primase catalytic core, N-terminal domain